MPKRSREEEKITVEEAAQYDRQIRLWGMDAQNRIKNASIAILGTSGLTCEIVKNLVLAGVRSITLIDDQIVKEEHLGSEFFLRQEDLNKQKAPSYVPRAQLLNPRVKITAKTSKVTEKDLKGVDFVFLNSKNVNEMIKVGKMCRKNKIKYWTGACCGWIGFFFCDLNTHEFTKNQTTGLLNYAPISELMYPNLKSERKRQLKNLETLICVLTKLHESVDPLYLEKLGIPTDVKGLLERIDRGWDYEMNPVCAVLAGVLSQEILKTISANGIPINNSYCYNALECRDAIYHCNKEV